MRETRQSGLEGGVRLIPHPYPYRKQTRAWSFVPPPDATSKSRNEESRKQKWHRGSTNKRGESQGWDGGDGVARRPYHQRFANAPGCNSFRVDEFPGRLPRVGTARQPWAGRGNPVGIREGVNRPSPQAEGRCVVRPSDSVPPPDAARGGEGGRGKEEFKIINDKVGTRARGERGGDEPSPEVLPICQTNLWLI
jgi:hypothetical protein